MKIGARIKNLRLKNNLTQEELAERTDVTKGFISQMERDISVPSMEVFFDVLEVLGTTPGEFFEEDKKQRIVYEAKDALFFEDNERGYQIQWLIPESAEKEMEPVLIELNEQGSMKKYPPSRSESFGYVLQGAIEVVLGTEKWKVETGNTFYFQANQEHQLRNSVDKKSKILLVVTHSYL
ncbi:helix-turn-helix domain-containing protein [Lacticigenium naphthae]|uniref:helix-turn-helix domain-containing protein n=1 Tax=Lacticigenium naphthae TaxID=515351 RepID=UPI00040CEB29|nr:XRE family transcriptional regulator [Lacticigenium naphthae]